MTRPRPGDIPYNALLCMVAAQKSTQWKLKPEWSGRNIPWGIVFSKPAQQAELYRNLIISHYEGQDFGEDAEAWFSWMLDNDDDVVEFLEYHYGMRDKAFYMDLLNQPPYWAEVPDEDAAE